jgi:hypothetical protein
MSRIYQHRNVVRVLAVFACTLLGLAGSAPAAFAVLPADVGFSGVTSTDSSPTVSHAIAAGGISGWQIAAIVAAAALLSAIVAVVADRARAAHRNRAVPAT